MANLSVRKLNDAVVNRLRLRAAINGVSMEEEVRQILEQAVSIPSDLGDMAVTFFGVDNGINLELSDHAPHQPVNLLE